MAQGMTNIAVIGCGWLGLPLSQHLINSGYKIKGSTTRASKLDLLSSFGIEPYQYNLYDDHRNINLEDLTDVDQVIINIPPGRDREDVVAHYKSGMKDLLEVISQGPCKRIIYISSIGVYANANQTITEEHLPSPEKESSRAVYAGEVLLNDIDTNKVILRMAGLVGGERQPGKWFATKTYVPGGDTPVNMIHLDDCIAIIAKIIASINVTGTYNVCADEHPIKRDFYTEQARKLKLAPATWLDGTLAHKIISNEKIKNDLEYSFIHPNPHDF